VLVLTERLRLEPISRRHGGDLYALHLDPAIAEWWDVAWSRADAEGEARRFAQGWEQDGVSKWMAYDRVTHELIGRGGMTRVHLDGEERLEVGWAVRGCFWGQGYASEIGQASLAFAFDRLEAEEVVAFTEPHNARSRAVMDRLGLTYRRNILHDGYEFVLYGLTAAQAQVD
jgi:[ribosomal protein S5]-alanine N-acetyltransferase